MSSIIHGFEYDIFISYRQKDNKYDGWVTEFVANLKKELEATFKEDISIYFDENPHDGLLETHSVDKSLEGKLKCLVLIPIISQTYCDPKSFAWQHEFCAFNKMAKEDQFGRDIKLSHGNVASRVLPVRIHDLDEEDKRLLENELGGVLRSVDFIYNAAGVNRPLTPSDNPEKNLNKTFYRDQINKVANAVKEIMDGLKNFDNRSKEPLSKPLPHRPRSVELSITPRKQKILALTALATLIVLLAGYYVFNFTSQGAKYHPKPLAKSIAVLPFKNLNEIPSNNFICDALSEDILMRLSQIARLKVISRQSTYAYKNSEKPAKRISQELGARFILDGSLQVNDKDLRITARLTDAQQDQIIWSESYNRTLTGIFKLQSEVAQSVVNSLKIKLNKSESEDLEKVDEFNLEAYKYYKQGLRNYDNSDVYQTLNSTVPFFEKALSIDSTLYLAYTALANCYMTYGGSGKATRSELYPIVTAALKKSEAINSQSPALYTAKAEAALWMEFNAQEYERFNEKAMELDPNDPNIYSNQGMYFSFTGQFNKSHEAIEKCMELDPVHVSRYATLNAFAYYWEHNYRKALEEDDKVLRTDPNYELALWQKGLFYIQLGEYQKAIDSFHQRKFGTMTNWALANAFCKIGRRDEAEKILQYNLDKLKIQYVPPAVIGHIYLAMANRDEACTWFLKQLTSRDGGFYWMAMIKMDPRMDALKGHPCYDEIMKGMPF